MCFWSINKNGGNNKKNNISIHNPMRPEITWGVNMSEKKEGCAQISLVDLKRLKAHKYGSPKLTTLQKFLWYYEVEIIIVL